MQDEASFKAVALVVASADEVAKRFALLKFLRILNVVDDCLDLFLIDLINGDHLLFSSRNILHFDLAVKAQDCWFKWDRSFIVVCYKLPLSWLQIDGITLFDL